MSDDDWENAIDEVVEHGTKEENKVADKFKDEDAYDSEEERKKKTQQKADVIAEQTREKVKAKDYDALFDKRTKKPV